MSGRETFRAVKARPVLNRLLVPTAEFFPNGPDPKAYCFSGRGTCMIPEVADGDFVIVSPAAELVPGKKVVIWFRDGSPPLIKRLLSYPKDGEGHLVFAMLNPYRVYRRSMDEIDRAHAIVGIYTPEQHDEAVRLHDRGLPVTASFIADRAGNCMRNAPRSGLTEGQSGAPRTSKPPSRRSR